MSFSSVRALLDACKAEGRPLYEVILRSDLAESGLTEAESRAAMRRLWGVMVKTSENYRGSDRSASGFAGGDAAKVEAAAAAGALYSGGYYAQVIAEALKTAECNACMKRIVAAPTAGSCGAPVRPMKKLSAARCMWPPGSGRSWPPAPRWPGPRAAARPRSARPAAWRPPPSQTSRAARPKPAPKHLQWR